MDDSDFAAWKETSKWFFDILRERQEEYKSNLDNLLERSAIAPFSFTDIQKQELIAYRHRAEVIEDICSIGYSDVVEDENADTN